MQISLEEAADLVIYQVAAARGVAEANGSRIDHVKLHGQFSDMALRDDDLAKAVVEAIKRAGPDLILISRSRGRLAEAGKKIGLRVAEEVFADRGYMADGTGVPRNKPGALLTDPEAAADQVEQMVTDNVVIAADGTRVDVKADTICIHGDTTGALAIVQAVRKRLTKLGCDVRPVRDWID
jgi:UPF0271 protein